MTWASVAGAAVGLVLLVLGAEFLVRGATAIAMRLGISPVVIGLTVVAFGTGAPELAVGVGGSRSGQADLALGNVIGSNIANVLLILGVAGTLSALPVSNRLVKVHIPVLVVVTTFAVVLTLDGSVSHLDGVLLLVAMITFTGWMVRSARSERAVIAAEYVEELERIEGAGAIPPMLISVTWVASGLTVLVVGAQVLVDSASQIAISLGISDLVVGLTVVAVGTSLPELATTVLAVNRGQRDLAVGNVVGSNVFNLLAVLGVTAVTSTEGIGVSEVARQVELPLMLLCAVVLWPIARLGCSIDRVDGVVFVVSFVSYLTYVVVDARGHAAPLTVTLVALVGLGPLLFLAVRGGVRSIWGDGQVALGQR